MFEFLKNKLKGALSVFSKKVEEEVLTQEAVQKDEQEEHKSEPERGSNAKAVKKEKSFEKEKSEKHGKNAEKEKPQAEAHEAQKTAPQPEPAEITKQKEEHKKEINKKGDSSNREEEKKETAQEDNKVETEEAPEKGGFLKRLFRRKKDEFEEEQQKENKEKEQAPKQPEADEQAHEHGIEAHVHPEEQQGEGQRRGLFSKISDAFTKKTLSNEQFDKLFWDLEVALLENNVAVEVIEKIKDDLKKELVNKPLPRSQIEPIIEDALRSSIESVFEIKGFDLVEKVREKKPFVILFLGINGSGKTTTIAKVAKLLTTNGLSCVMAAGDTFRAAAIDQLEKHAQNLGVKLIKHQYGADSAAVAFDAIKYAEAHGINAVLIDTAGRMHSNTNLMDELKKIVRVSKPDLKIFVGEAITGNDCIEQAVSFDRAVGIDAIILAKADIDEKGGTALSIGYVTRKPILYLGTGQNYEDLEAFDKQKIIAGLGL